MEILPIIISGVGGLLLGLTPKIVDALKARGDDERKTKRFDSSQWQRLVEEIRAEREQIRVELGKLRYEHAECLQRAAAQEKQIEWLAEVVERQRKDIDELKQHGRRQPNSEP